MANIVRELTQLRSLSTKTFETDDPQVRVLRAAGTDLHYVTAAGAYDDIDNFVQPVTGGWIGTSNEVSWGIQNGYLSLTYKGRTLTMRPSSIWMVDRTDPYTRNRKLADASYANVTRSGKIVTVTNIFPNVDLQVTISPKELAKQFIVKTKPTLPDPVGLGWDPSRTYLVFDWDVNVPSGAVVTDAVTGQRLGLGFYAGTNDLVVSTPSGDPVIYFRAGHTLSASRTTRPVYYVSKLPELALGEAIPYHYTQVAQYPLAIDPTSNFGAISGTVGYVENAQYLYTDAISYGGWNDGKGGNYYYRGFIAFDLSSAGGGSTVTDATWHYYPTYDNNGSLPCAVYDVGNYGSLSTDDYNLSLGSQVGYQPAFNASQWNTWRTYSWNSWLSAINTRAGQVLGCEFRNDNTVYYANISTSSYLELTYSLPHPVPDGAGMTVDAYKANRITGSFAANATKKGTQSGSFALNAVILQSKSGSFTAAATLLRTKVTGVDLVAPTIDAYVGELIYRGFALDAIIKGQTAQASFTANAITKATGSGWFDIDRFVAWWYTADALISVPRSGTLTAAATKLRTQSGTFTAAAVIKGTASGALTANAAKRATLAGSFTAAAIGMRTAAGTFTTNAVLRSTLAASFTANAIVKGPKAGSLTADATKLRTQSGTAYTLNATRLRTQSGSIAVAAFIRPYFSISAYIFAKGAGSFTANAVKTKTISGSLTLNALVKATGSATVFADAVIHRAQTAAFSTEAVKLQTGLAGTTLAARIQRTRTDGFTASAVILSVRTPSFGADALITGSVGRYFVIDASIGGALYTPISATSSAATIAATSTAATIAATSSAATIASSEFVSHHNAAFSLDARLV